jgi:alanyl-tRNA synthetase
MNQFKDVFTGRERREFARAASAQKCVRAGGKHNDLENVGRTARHHTFFEMLGNFSFGDYFKAEAIALAWELLTKDLQVPAERIMVTIFGGDAKAGLPADEEARTLWRDVAGLPDDRILGLGLHDNFWQMADTGPCGPCSEIHYYQGEDVPCSERRCLGPACDCDRWLEVWNLVFMQYERDESGRLAQLPAPSVDTGMGLERLCAVLQGKRSNYETDLFAPLLSEVERLVRRAFDPADYGGPSVSMRAIADHARATAFLMADGVLPEKTGREYVLRRIMRRAIYHGSLLGIEDPFFDAVVDTVIAQMGGAYPELQARRSMILELTRLEETRFRETLGRGVRILEDEFTSMSRSRMQVPGEVAFRLYDTFGFPLDLTQVIAEARGFSVDVGGYEAAMAEQRKRSSFLGSGETRVDDVLMGIRAAVGPTEFVGYTADEADATVLRMVAGQREIDAAGAGVLAFVTDRTPFYGEQGGQVGDAGEATGPDGLVLRITDTQKVGGDLHVHFAEILAGELRRGSTVHLRVDTDRREAIRKNHSATHLLHWALRQVLGEHVAQKGSDVAPDRLRFDFSHSKPLTSDEIHRVERLVNEHAWRDAEVHTAEMGLGDALQSGAIAFFGEKYGDRVRVVEMGESTELCGGTHVRRTGEIGQFKIVEESGIAQGTRRIFAVTGAGALAYTDRLEGTVRQVGEMLRASPAEVVDKVERLQADARALERQVSDLRARLASGTGRELGADIREIHGVKVLVSRVEVADARALRTAGDELRKRLGSGVVVLGGVADGKVTLVGMVTADLTERVQASAIVERVAALVGGRGGGRPDLAQGGGTDPSRLDAALDAVYELVEQALRLSAVSYQPSGDQDASPSPDG